MKKPIRYDIDTNNCHTCISHTKNYLGYIGVNKSVEGKKVRTMHRYIFLTKVGNIPDGIHVLHKCDNRACINPEHLFLGTHQDNMTDKMQKGRARTEKLSLEQVIEIRLSKGAMGQRKLAKLYGISQQHISDIQTGRKRARI